MEPKFLRAICDRAAIADQLPGTPIRFVASTQDVARDGMIVEAAGWQLNNYRANPVFLWAHDYECPPIGRADTMIENGALMCEVTFDQGDEFAREIERKYRTGFMNAVSVGWTTLEFAPPKGANQAPRVTKAELLDISAVPVPADPGALKERKARGMDNLRKMIDHALGDEAESQWLEASAGMVEVFTPGLDDDETRQAKYKALLPKYRREGKTPPEFMPLDVLRLLSIEDVRGLFFHGEMAEQQARIGAVLSARNRDDLTQAITLIQGVIERATNNEPQTNSQDKPDEDQADPMSRAAIDQLLAVRLAQAFKI